MQLNKLLLILLVVVLSGCAHPKVIHGPLFIHDDLVSGYNLDEMRKARKTIKYTKALPDGAKLLSTIRSNRCEREANVIPNDESFIDDFKILTYMAGGDGFTNIKIETSGFNMPVNCWSVKEATADIYTFSDE